MVQQRGGMFGVRHGHRRSFLSTSIRASLGIAAGSSQIFAQAIKPVAAKPTVEPDVLTAWQKIRGELTWVGPWAHGVLLWSARADDLHDAVPGFYLNQIGNVDFAKLPEPAVPWGLYLGQTHLTAAQIKQLKAFRLLQYLNLRVTPGNKTCPGLGDVSKLQGLVLNNFEGSDDLIRSEVSKLKNLKHLGLTTGKYTGSALTTITGMKQLETLELGLLSIPDTGYAALGKMTNLKSLILKYDVFGAESPKIGKVTVAAIGKLTDLEFLSLSGSTLKDADVDAIAKLSKLKSLQLQNEKLSDAAVAKLHGLKELKAIDFSSSKVSKEAVSALKGALPSVKISK